jgi:CDP-diglyceride synthetase
MRYLRRGVWFLVSRMAVLVLVLSLIVVVFYEAMDMTNIQDRSNKAQQMALHGLILVFIDQLH